MERHEETTTCSQHGQSIERFFVLAYSERELCAGGGRRGAAPHERATGATGGADRSLSGFGAVTDFDGLNLSVGGRRGSSLGAEQFGSHGPGAGRRDAEAAVG